MRIWLFTSLLLAGCSGIPGLSGVKNPLDPAVLIEAASKDPADIKLQAAYMGGTVTYERKNPNPVSSCPK